MRAGEWGLGMKHYRVNKVTKPGGPIVKTKDILAKDDADAVRTARADNDCPVCDVFHAGQRVGRVN